MGTSRRIQLLSPREVAELSLGRGAPDSFRVRVEHTPVLLALGVEELLVHAVRDASLQDAHGRVVRPGELVCLLSGSRITWRRALAVRHGRVLVRGDVVPFADGWVSTSPLSEHEPRLLGRVEPRALDRLAQRSPLGFVRGNWAAAVALSRFKAAQRRRARARKPVRRAIALRTKLMTADEWQLVRAFWLRASGRELPEASPLGTYVVGLFHEDLLIGVNIQLVTGLEAYSAYTMIERGYRDVGGSRLLLDEAMRVAEKLGLKRVYVHIHVRNIPSLAAYQRAGFSPVGWWRDDSDPLLAAERQWRVFERLL